MGGAGGVPRGAAAPGVATARSPADLADFYTMAVIEAGARTLVQKSTSRRAYSSVARGCRGSYRPSSPPAGSRMLVNSPQPSSLISPQLTPLALRSSTVALTSSHIRYNSWDPPPSAGCTATSPGGSLKISQPPPASTCGY